MRHSQVIQDPIKHVLQVFWMALKISTKSVSLRSLNKGSKCEGKILITIQEQAGPHYYSLYKNSNEECSIGFKAHAHDVLLMFW